MLSCILDNFSKFEILIFIVIIMPLNSVLTTSIDLETFDLDEALAAAAEEPFRKFAAWKSFVSNLPAVVDVTKDDVCSFCMEGFEDSHNSEHAWIKRTFMCSNSNPWQSKAKQREHSKMENKIPQAQAVLNCIDLSNPNTHHSVHLLKQSCTDSGFFYLVNHGISQDFMDEVFAQSKKFFTLPLNEKMKLLRNDNHRGYTPLQDEILDPQNQLHGDYKEGYYIGVENNGQNIWPASDVLPGWRETMEEFQLRALEVGKAIAKIIALALGLDANFFDKPETLGESVGVMRLLHYQDKISDPSQGLYAAGAHTDYGLITLLATDDVQGLQICKNKDAKPQIWEDVTPLKGAFIVNIGDMLERWSNCTFKSTLHRVIGNGQERYSIAYFLDPGHDCLVECLPTCKSDANPPKFPPIYFRDYLSQRYKDTYGDVLVYSKHQS